MDAALTQRMTTINKHLTFDFFFFDIFCPIRFIIARALFPAKIFSELALAENKIFKMKLAEIKWENV